MPKKILEEEPKLAILKYLKGKNYIVWRHHKNTYNAKAGVYFSDPYTPNGIADILFINPKGGQLVGLEVKRPKGGVKSAAQLTMQRRFRLNNAEYHFVKSVDEVKDLGI